MQKNSRKITNLRYNTDKQAGDTYHTQQGSTTHPASQTTFINNQTTTWQQEEHSDSHTRVKQK